MKNLNNLLIVGGVLLVGGVALAPSFTSAQMPPPAAGRAASASGPVDRLMAFDADGDGKLSKQELSDERLQDLFARADANQDGFVTREELTALFKKEASTAGNRGPGGPGGAVGFSPSGPGRPGGPGSFDGDRGPGGPDGFGGRRRGGPQPGQVLPAFVQEMLSLSDDQKRQVDALQTEVDAKLGKILSTEQRQQLQALRERGPGGTGGERGPGGLGGPRGFGGPGGPRR